MKADHRNTLLLAFEKGHVPPPKEGERWVVLNGKVLPEDPFGAADALYEQGFRPEYLALERARASTTPHIEAAQTADHAIILAGRVRAVNEANMARAWDMVGEGGIILVAGDKQAGIGSLRKWAGKQVPIGDSLFKHHAVAFWLRKETATGTSLAAPAAAPMFSADAPDTGSQLLAEFFDDRIKGKIADFGAGSGYLTSQLLKASSKVEAVDLIEAEWSALEQAKTALANNAVPLSFQWIDITTELKKRPYEWIIMNPPFHHGLHGGNTSGGKGGRQADPQLGKQFIQHAASTLIQGGRLLMVANRNLPYEETLEKAFRKHTKLADQAGYKVFEAVK